MCEIGLNGRLYRSWFKIVCLMSALCLGQVGTANVYKIIDRKGHVTFTDKNQPGAKRLSMYTDLDNAPSLSAALPKKKLPPTKKLQTRKKFLTTRARFIEEIAIIKRGLDETRQSLHDAKNAGLQTEVLENKLNVQRLYLESLKAKLRGELEQLVEAPQHMQKVHVIKKKGNEQ